ncbi:MAG: hypothetical protein KA886_05695, partial [Candidatus Cloacimonetes bacterium]|nr:hypothetical protein [Candidatus Cloacimonadota bacterium]
MSEITLTGWSYLNTILVYLVSFSGKKFGRTSENRTLVAFSASWKLAVRLRIYGITLRSISQIPTNPMIKLFLFFLFT